ncbi:hypothetical protein B296_00029424 [Ensete ventricosum]|uniref:Uncharacterized protein n=1 Tax=Ensete ventricosum TaxID=4639 RepID=A0A426ZZH5_ENSVE|nr:hypothetical protein B296_00029424 [Ensete ventricosum]
MRRLVTANLGFNNEPRDGKVEDARDGDVKELSSDIRGNFVLSHDLGVLFLLFWLELMIIFSFSDRKSGKKSLIAFSSTE